MTYFSRVCLRSSRLPRSRKANTTASATSFGVGRHPGERVGQTRKRVVGPGMARPRPPPTRTAKPSAPSGSGHGHQSEVVAEDVGAVVTRPGQPDLELPRGRPCRTASGSTSTAGAGVGRLGADGTVTVDPHLVVGTGPRAEAGGKALGQVEQDLLPAVRQWRGQATTLRTTSPHRRQRGHQVPIQRADERRQPALAGEMELHAAAEVSRSEPSATSPATPSMAAHCEAESAPPGTLARTMKMCSRS